METEDAPSLLRVGEVAAITGQTVRAIHYYEQQGLVRPSRAAARGHRLYDDDDVRRLATVALLRRTGMTTAEIRRWLTEPDATVSAMIGAQLGHLEQRITALSTLRNRLMELVGEDDGADPLALSARAARLTEQRYSAEKAVALLPYSNVAAAQHWLMQNFGLEPGPGGLADDSGGTRFASMVTSQGLIQLHQATPDLQPPSRSGTASAMVVITVDDLNLIADRLRDGEEAQVNGPYPTHYGVWELTATDLEGHPWCFHCPIIEGASP